MVIGSCVVGIVVRNCVIVGSCVVRVVGSCVFFGGCMVGVIGICVVRVVSCLIIVSDSGVFTGVECCMVGVVSCVFENCVLRGVECGLIVGKCVARVAGSCVVDFMFGFV